MPKIARDTDDIDTGHGCDAITQLIGQTGAANNVFANGLPWVALGDPTVVHEINSGASCVPHTAVVNAASPNVFVGGIAVARVGDSADAGSIIEGSPNVFANG